MIYSLKNDYIKIEVDTKSAELKSLVKNAKEYMWQGNPDIWGRTSPLLFPLTGGTNHPTVKLNGKDYPMPKHGFAANMEFEAGKITDEKLVFTLTDTPETLKVWPCPFRLTVTYTLNEAAVNINLSVTNTGNDAMFFALGAHPGFKCPAKGHSFRAYIQNPSDNSNLLPAARETISVLCDRGILSHETKDVHFNDGYLPINKTLFDEGKGTLVFTDTNIKRVSLADESRREYIAVDFDTSVLSLWSSENPNADFACIEPWCGVCDYEDTDDDWSQRPFTNKLNAGETFNNCYSITILEK